MNAPERSQTVSDGISAFRKHTKLTFFFIAVLIMAIVWFVYVTGGTRFVYAHAIYVPIVIASTLFGWKGGLSAALAGGLALGPFMPMDTVTGEMQAPFNWLFRLFMLIVIGVLVGYSSDSIRYYLNRIVRLLTHHPRTGLPLLRTETPVGAKDIVQSKDRDPTHILALRILNHSEIASLVGISNSTVVLRALYDNLKEHLPGDTVIYHAEDDCLVIFLYQGTQAEWMKSVADIPDRIVEVDDIPVNLECSVGAAKHVEEKLDATVERAMIAALYASDRNVAALAYDKTQEQRKADLLIAGSFEEALQNGDVRLVFQPIISSQSGRLEAEALMRWKHDDLGELSPGRFIPLLERTTLIQKLDRWVLSQALATIKRYRDSDCPITLFINLSGKNVTDKDLMLEIAETIEAADLPKGALGIEVTESTFMHHSERAVEALDIFSKLGCTVAVDDFGTGYSSLSYLRSLPVDRIKIDKSLIDNILTDAKAEKIVAATLNLAHELGLKTVGEGVEDSSLTERLARMGCDAMQGFNYSPPLEDEAFKEWLQNAKQV